MNLYVGDADLQATCSIMLLIFVVLDPAMWFVSASWSASLMNDFVMVIFLLDINVVVLIGLRYLWTRCCIVESVTIVIRLNVAKVYCVICLLKFYRQVEQVVAAHK